VEVLACFTLGQAYSHGTGVAKDASRAIPYLTKACTRGVGPSCHVLASHYRKGLGVPQDDAEAARLTAQACSLGVAKACAK
jgi:TPR repeat protein